MSYQSCVFAAVFALTPNLDFLSGLQHVGILPVTMPNIRQPWEWIDTI